MNGDFALVRYMPDGTPDNSFSGDGKLTTDIANSWDVCYALAIQPDGRIVAAGAAGTGQGFGLARYVPDGTLDTSFSGDGKLVTPFAGDAWAVKLLPDGRIIAGGNSGGDFALARYMPDGSLDTSFSTDGMVTTSIGSGNNYVGSLALQPDGRIIAGGSTMTTGTAYASTANSQAAVVRYMPDGRRRVSWQLTRASNANLRESDVERRVD